MTYIMPSMRPTIVFSIIEYEPNKYALGHVNHHDGSCDLLVEA